MHSFTLSLTSALDGVWVGNAMLLPTYPRERHCTHCTGGWVGPQGGTGRLRKISPPPGLDPRTVQPVTSSYTDRVIQAQVSSIFRALIRCIKHIKIPKIELRFMSVILLSSVRRRFGPLMWSSSGW